MKRVAERDPALAVRVTAGLPLRYSTPAAGDRPAAVRAASGLAWFDGALAVVQDDARYLARVDSTTGGISALPLPSDANGARVQPKHLKADHECACVLPDGRLLVLGSGSRPTREGLVLVDSWQGPVRSIAASALYRGLRACTAFAGSELNVEGAVWQDDALWLFNRGNGAVRDGRRPVDACAALEGRALLAWLRDPTRPPPLPTAVRPYALGVLDDCRLSFTDAARRADGALFYLAAAERSADAYCDGSVAGSVLGVLTPSGGRWAPVEVADAAPLKLEGLCQTPDGAWYAVADPDAPDAVALLYRLELSGPW